MTQSFRAKFARVLLLGCLAAGIVSGCETTTPSEIPKTDISDLAENSFMFLEGNNCTQDVVGELTDERGQIINLKEVSWFENDETRSVALLNVRAGTLMRVFDSPQGDKSDDWTEITTLKSIQVYCLPSFETTYDDGLIRVDFHHVNGLDGKVSRIEIDERPSDEEAIADSKPSSPTEAPSSPPEIPPIAVMECIPKGTTRQVASVAKIIDGDTIDVLINGDSFTVRYIGMDTPETGDRDSNEATSKNAGLVQGGTITLIKDVSETDKYGRLLRYVLIGDIFVNYELVRSGYAMTATFPPDVACSSTFSQAQGLALTEGIGLWSTPPTLPPTIPPPPSPTSPPQPAPTSPPPPQNCHPSYEGVCLQMGIGDYDCAGGSGNGPNYVRGPVRVVGYDEFRLDRDGDGIGCES